MRTSLNTGHVKIKYFFSLINIIFILLLFFIYALSSENGSIGIITIMGIIQYIWMFFSWYKISKNIFNVYSLIIALSMLFYLGQPILTLLELSSYKVMSIETSPFPVSNIMYTLVFLLSAMLLFHCGVLCSYRIKKRLSPTINTNDVLFLMRSIGILMFSISVIPTINSSINNLLLTFTVGYSEMLQNEFYTGTGIDGGIPRFLTQFFKPALLLLIIGYHKVPTKLYFWISFSLLYSIIMILAGSRGPSTLFVIGVILVWHYLIRPFTKKQVLLLFITVIIISFLFSVISTIRNLGSHSFDLENIIVTMWETLNEKNNPLIDLIAEMGFTLIASTTVMTNCPSPIPYNLGATYYNSLWAIIPNLFWDVNPGAYGSVDSIFSPFLFKTSGMGSSFIVEAYYNFGIFSLLTFPIFGFLVGKLYSSTINSINNKDYLKFYNNIYITTVILWYVRSETIMFWRHYVLYALFPVIVIKTLLYVLKKEIKNDKKIC